MRTGRPLPPEGGLPLTWGERVYAEKRKMMRKILGNAEEARENKNPAMPWGLRDERRDNIIY